MTGRPNSIPRVSFEFFPPVTRDAEPGLLDTVDRLAPLGPEFVTVTYGAGGGSRDRSDRTLRHLLARGDLDVAAHLTCVGASRTEIEETVLAWAKIGVRRFVALRGDMPRIGDPFQAHPRGYASAVDLVAGLRRLGDFDISVGAYPEVHPEASSPAADIEHLKRKLDAGAARAITQYFFEPEAFLRFRDRAARAGIEQAIVPGILPVFDFEKVATFSRKCGARIPAWLAQRFEGLDSETQDLVAVTTASEICGRLRTEGITQFHFYTLNRASLTHAICRTLGLRPNLERAA